MDLNGNTYSISTVHGRVLCSGLTGQFYAELTQDLATEHGDETTCMTDDPEGMLSYASPLQEPKHEPVAASVEFRAVATFRRAGEYSRELVRVDLSTQAPTVKMWCSTKQRFIAPEHSLSQSEMIRISHEAWDTYESQQNA